MSNVLTNIAYCIFDRRVPSLAVGKPINIWKGLLEEWVESSPEMPLYLRVDNYSPQMLVHINAQMGNIPDAFGTGSARGVAGGKLNYVLHDIKFVLII